MFMIQRVTRLGLAALLLLFSVTAFTQTVTNVVAQPPRTIDIREYAKSLQWEPATDTPSRSPLRSASPAPDNIRWIDRIHNLPDYLLSFYNFHHAKVQDALNGKTNYLVDYKSGTRQVPDLWENTYMIPINTCKSQIDIHFPNDVANAGTDATRAYIQSVIEDEVFRLDKELGTFIPYTFMSMSYDNPDAFWLGNYYSWCSAYSYTYYAMTNSVEINYTAYFIIKSDVFDYRIEPFRTTAEIRSGITEFKALVDSILKDVPSSTRYVKLRYLNDWLTKHNAYASNYDSKNSPSIVWSPMSALRGTSGDSGPVCEAYSRALKVLLDKLDIPCMLAVGYAKWDAYSNPESHMWNEVKMNDGQWYAVDVTWNDPLTGSANELKQSGAENEDWLLLGRNTRVPSGITFAQSHPNSLVYGQSESSNWDYDNETLIADTRFDVSTYSVPQVANTSGAVTVYSILGVNMGTFESAGQALSSLESGIYIINGRKHIIK